MNTKSEIGVLALSRLGSYNGVLDLDDPKTAPERILRKWYDISRQETIKVIAPNFALKRSLTSKSVVTPEFGPAYCYEIPSDCLRVLGLGEIQEKENNYSVEGEYIITDEDYEDGAPVRYVKDITDVSKFTPDFISMLAWKWAYNCCMELTKDKEKFVLIEKLMPKKLMDTSSLNGLENRPIRINKSKFKLAKYQTNPTTEDKR